MTAELRQAAETDVAPFTAISATRKIFKPARANNPYQLSALAIKLRSTDWQILCQMRLPAQGTIKSFINKQAIASLPAQVTECGIWEITNHGTFSRRQKSEVRSQKLTGNR